VKPVHSENAENCSMLCALLLHKCMYRVLRISCTAVTKETKTRVAYKDFFDQDTNYQLIVLTVQCVAHAFSFDFSFNRLISFGDYYKQD